MPRQWVLKDNPLRLKSNGRNDYLFNVTPPDPTERGTLTRLRGKATGAVLPPDPPGFTWPPPDSTWAPLPDQPSVNYVDFYTSGDTVREVCNKVNNYCVAQGSTTSANGYRQIILPNGFDGEFADFSMAGTSKLGLYSERILGFIGEGEDTARVRLKFMSSTVGTNGMMVRFASSLRSPLPENPLPGGLIPLDYGFTLQGTRQPDQVYAQGGLTGPQIYAGKFWYRTRNAIIQRVRFQGTSCANWNSPPGETFSINAYKTRDCIWRGVEVDGYDANHERWGGSPFGGNNSDGDLIEDCWFHHGYRSGFTHSFAGTENDINAISKNVTTRRMRLEHNANIAPRVNGSQFGGINMENVGGTVLHEDLYVQVDNNQFPGQYLWNAAHVSVNGKLFDNPNIVIDNPTWNPLHPRYTGCFIINWLATYGGATNSQVTPPTVINRFGNPMTPITWTSGGNGTPPVRDPDLYYYWLKAS